MSGEAVEIVRCSLCDALVDVRNTCSTLACRACHKTVSFEDCIEGTRLATKPDRTEDDLRRGMTMLGMQWKP